MDSKLPLSEYVKMDQWPEISSALAKKYADYETGTYGVELEFDPLLENNESREDYILRQVDEAYLRKAIGRDGRFDSAYEDWLVEKRKEINRYSRRGWDDSYGPPDLNDWDDMNAEPDPSEEEEHDQWESDRRDAEHDYDYWYRRDRDNYEEEFVKELGVDAFDYIDESRIDQIYRSLGGDQKTRSKDTAIKKVQQWLIGQGEKLNGSGTGTVDSWNVGPDGEYVEIRSKHLKLEDFPIVEALMDFLKDHFSVSADNSAHVHVGMPKDFDAFDLLVMTTLVDEGEVSNSVSKARQEKFKEWAHLRDEVESRLNKVVGEMMQTPGNVEKTNRQRRFKIPREKFEQLIKQLSKKFTGTNIEAFQRHHTVEFRYFSSEMKNPRNLLSWIRYFMMLPVIAKKRNHAKLGIYTFIRGEDYITLIVSNKK